MPRRSACVCLVMALLGLAFGQSSARAEDHRVAVHINVLATPPFIAEKHLKEGTAVHLDRAKATALLETVQGGLRAESLHCLDVTVASGQRLDITANGKQESVAELSLLPAISKDHQSIRLTLKVKLVPVGPFLVWQPTGQVIGTFGPGLATSTKGKDIAAGETFTVRDGWTAVFDVGTRTESFHETTKVPVLCDLPYLGWLFIKERWRQEKQRILVLVTPSILRR